MAVDHSHLQNNVYSVNIAIRIIIFNLEFEFEFLNKNF